MSVKLRQELERRIATIIIEDALAAGYEVAIDNGGDEYELRSTDKAALVAALMASDDDRLFLYRPGADRWYGWVWLIYGNDGWDVVSDYTTNLEALLTRAGAEADKYQD